MGTKTLNQNFSGILAAASSLAIGASVSNNWGDFDMSLIVLISILSIVLIYGALQYSADIDNSPRYQTYNSSLYLVEMSTNPEESDFVFEGSHDTYQYTLYKHKETGAFFYFEDPRGHDKGRSRDELSADTVQGWLFGKFGNEGAEALRPYI